MRSLVCHICVLFLTATLQLANADSFLTCQEPHSKPAVALVDGSVDAWCTRFPHLQWKICAQRLLQSLAKRAGLSGESDLRVHIIQAPQANAFAVRPANVVLTSSLLERVRSHDELAFILAHELGHLALHHSDDSIPQPLALVRKTRHAHLARIEVDADRFAATVLSAGGYNPQAAQQVMQRVARGSEQAGSPLCSESMVDQRLEALQQLSPTDTGVQMLYGSIEG